MSERDAVLWTSMLAGYSQKGELTYAQLTFDGMPVRDVFTWSSLILGYGLSGEVLSACAHGGLVEQGRLYLEMMEVHGVVPELKHYANMVDCLGRAGRLEEAERLVEEMPVEPDEAVLGAVLGSCRVHNNVEVGERIAKKLIRLKPEKAGYYVLLSNMYATSGRFEDAQVVRELMKNKNVAKVPGVSF
ncbi:Pentatricopeptide repeat-containing protein At4g14170 [Linum perenne]